MLAQTSAFLTRSIRQESRLLSHHLIRSAMVVFTLFVFIVQALESPRRGASGLNLINSIMNCWYGCLTLLGIMYFSVAITEEKEEDTLPLLRMTGVRNFTLLLGKSLPRLAVVVLLILVAAPFLMLAQTLGGVLPGQIVASLLGILCYAFCLSQAALLASTLCRNSQQAVSLTFMFWLLLEFGSWLVYLAALICAEWRYGSGWRFPPDQSLYWLFARLHERTFWQASGTFMLFERGESVWHPQMTFQLLTGAALFVISLLIFERFSQAALAQGGAHSVTAGRGFRARTSSVRSIRCWDQALQWKSWQFLVGGRFKFISWLLGLPVASIATILVISISLGETVPAEVYGGTLFGVGLAALAILMAQLFGNMLNREIQQQTLVSLCTLPQSRASILKGLAQGLLPALVAPLFCFALGWLLLAFSVSGWVLDTLHILREPWFWVFIGWIIVTVHFGTLLSVYLRHGGMLIAVAVAWFAVPFMLGMCIALAGTIFRGIDNTGETFLRYVIPVLLIGAEVLICIAFQRMILHQVEELAGK